MLSYLTVLTTAGTRRLGRVNGKTRVPPKARWRTQNFALLFRRNWGGLAVVLFPACQAHERRDLHASHLREEPATARISNRQRSGYLTRQPEARLLSLQE